MNAVLANLPDASAHRANKDAARGLLMKYYLNRGVYANRSTPTFAAAEMNIVISRADRIISTGRYKFATNYFDKFAPDNTNIGTENIFTEQNIGGVSSGAQYDLWRFISHYNMVPTGCNGLCALSDFYDKYGATGIRRGTVYRYTNGPANYGNRQNVGYLIGQQYNLNTDIALTDRPGWPLAFTRTVNSSKLM